MAGGGYGKGSGVPLGERVRAGEHRSDADPGRTSTHCPARHCWVVAPVDATVARPGLLLEWRKSEHRWEGRVIYLAELRPGRWSTIEEWIPQELLTGVEVRA